MLARVNIAEEQSPWAIIISMAPLTPQDDRVISPAVKIPIWPTDE